jgi:hypothetical protein
VCRINKIHILAQYEIIIVILAIIHFRCEHKKYLNPYDPENLPPAPSLLSPVAGITTIQNPPDFAWILREDITNPLYGEQLVYEIQMSNDQNFSSIHFDDSTIYTEEYLPYKHIGEGNQYWRVRAQYIHGGWGEWSEIRNFDVKFPVIGSCDIWFQDDIAIKDNLIFLACDNTLSIIDISNPSNPHLIGTYSESNTIFNYIFVVDNYLYTTGCYTYPSYQPSFSIYNIANPIHPILLDQFVFYNDSPLDLWVENEKAYICREGNSILVFDVSNPESMFVVDSLPVPGKKICIENNYAYILFNTVIYIFDLATGTTISSIHPVGSFVQSFSISDNYAYIVGSSTWIYDISNSYNPFMVSTIYNSGYAIAAAKNFLFFTSFTAEYPLLSLEIYNIIDPSIPEHMGSIRYVYGEIIADENYVYTAEPNFLIIKYE